MPFVMTVRGAKRQYSTAEATLRRMSQLQVRPSRFAPPPFLRGVDISRSTIDGWPVYEVAPRTGAAPRRALYLHGGAYVFEIAAQHWMLVAQLAVATGTRFTVPIYPLAPAATADTIVAGASALASALIESVGAEKVTIMGDSAGGGMALAVAMRIRDTQPDGTQPRTILISPWLDISGTDPQLAIIAPRDPWLAVPGSHAAGVVYRGDLAEDDPTVSPLFGDFSGLGPITMLSGTRDILNADARRLVRRARAENIPLDYHEATDMIHVWVLLPIPEARSARAVIAAALLRA